MMHNMQAGKGQPNNLESPESHKDFVISPNMIGFQIAGIIFYIQLWSDSE